MIFLRLIWESLTFALQALKANILRTILSLLGVTIGIFAIIAVLTIVDSLERNIREDMSFIGTNVMYVQKFPWSFGDSDYPWWKYMKRPDNTIDEFLYLEENLKNAEGVALFLYKFGVTVKRGSYSISSVLLHGTSHGLPQVRDTEIAEGRFFLKKEIDNGKNVVLIGSDIAKALFPQSNALGQEVKLNGYPFTVIGVMKEEGANMFGDNPNDERFIVPYPMFMKLYQVGNKGIQPTIAAKGFDYDDGLYELEGEVTGLMRAKRGLKPTEDSNFALNRTEYLSDAIGSLFSVMSTVGWIIGSFSMLVGAFGIANIMFVSVKERTNIIGIQKALGAKNYFILFQFLFEAVFLSIIGGLAGLFLVYLITFIPLGSLKLALSVENILTGIIVSSAVGVLAGVLPAFSASKLNPVVAIRSGQ